MPCAWVLFFSFPHRMGKKGGKHVVDFIIATSSAAEHLCFAEESIASLRSPFVAITVENGASWVLCADNNDTFAPHFAFFGGARFLSAVAGTEHFGLFAEKVAYACARYGKKMYRHVARDMPYAVLDGERKKIFFSSVYLEEKTGAIFIASRPFLLEKPNHADFGSVTLSKHSVL